ncbi:RHS-family protein [Bacillus sp. LL01]|nr:RHS-family protein [Bacillus sp. LL01]
MEPAMASGPVNVLDGSFYKKELQENNKNIITRIEIETGKGKGKLELEDFTKEILRTKPMNSPIPEKWYKKGGVIAIDGEGTWIYTNKTGVTINYPNGYPDFSQYAHPIVKPVEIQIAKPINRREDNKRANIIAGLNKDSNPPVPAPNQPPKGYTWHHHQDGKTMILVDRKVHAEFTHSGGVSTVNGK